MENFPEMSLELEKDTQFCSAMTLRQLEVRKFVTFTKKYRVHSIAFPLYMDYRIWYNIVEYNFFNYLQHVLLIELWLGIVISLGACNCA